MINSRWTTAAGLPVTIRPLLEPCANIAMARSISPTSCTSTGMPWRANVVNDPARAQRRAGALVRCSAAPLLLHDDRRADLDPVIEIDHVLIGHANAAR